MMLHYQMTSCDDDIDSIFCVLTSDSQSGPYESSIGLQETWWVCDKIKTSYFRRVLGIWWKYCSKGFTETS